MNKQTSIYAILVVGIAGGFACTGQYIDKAAIIHSRAHSPALSQIPSPDGKYSRVKGFVSYGPSYYRRELIFTAPNLKALETDALEVSGTVRLAGSAPNHSQLSFLEVSEVNADSGASRSGIPVTVDKAGAFDEQIPLTLGGGNYELRVSDPNGGQRLQPDVVMNDAVVALRIFNTSGGVSSSSTSTQIPAIDTRVEPAGADKQYLVAVRKVVARCGQFIQLLGVFAERSDGKDYYTFYGNCDSGVGVEIIEVPFNGKTGDVGEPWMRRVGVDVRKPINLADWQISSKNAFELAGAPSGGVQLLRSADQFVWAADVPETGGAFEIRIDAKTGKIVSSEHVQLRI